MSDSEVSARVDELAAKLRDEGASAWADSLEAAVAGGATGTEILVRLGAELHRLRRARGQVTRPTRKLATRLARQVDRQLRLP